MASAGACQASDEGSIPSIRSWCFTVITNGTWCAFPTQWKICTSWLQNLELSDVGFTEITTTSLLNDKLKSPQNALQ